jgi:hypothetical protein
VRRVCKGVGLRSWGKVGVLAARPEAVPILGLNHITGDTLPQTTGLM